MEALRCESATIFTAGERAFDILSFKYMCFPIFPSYLKFSLDSPDNTWMDTFALAFLLFL